MSAIARAWSRRAESERRILAIAAAVAALLLLVAFAWLPVERTRARLAHELPTLRASIAGLERDAAEVKRLRALPAAAPAAASPLATLATNGGGLAGATITVLDPRRVRVAGADIGYDNLLEWLGNAQATHGMRVESARLDALPTAGRVRAELVLARS